MSLFLMYASLFAASVISLIIPVFIGRKQLDIWMTGTKVHELYTKACGLCVLAHSLGSSHHRSMGAIRLDKPHTLERLDYCWCESTGADILMDWSRPIINRCAV